MGAAQPALAFRGASCACHLMAYYRQHNEHADVAVRWDRCRNLYPRQYGVATVPTYSYCTGRAGCVLSIPSYLIRSD